MKTSSITLKYGDKTENLLQAILSELSDEVLSEVDIDREIADTSGLASEPITISVTITIAVSSVLIVNITRLIERWLENKRRKESETLLINAYNVSKAAGDALKELQIKHADVSISYALSKEKANDRDKA